MKKLIIILILLNNCVKNVRNLSTLNKGVNEDLRTASFSGDLNSIIKILDTGVDVNYKSNIGDTALMRASSKGYIGIAKLLIEKGADIDSKGKYGETALMQASEKDI